MGLKTFFDVVNVGTNLIHGDGPGENHGPKDSCLTPNGDSFWAAGDLAGDFGDIQYQRTSICSMDGVCQDSGPASLYTRHPLTHSIISAKDFEKYGAAIEKHGLLDKYDDAELVRMIRADISEKKSITEEDKGKYLKAIDDIVATKLSELYKDHPISLALVKEFPAYHKAIWNARYLELYNDDELSKKIADDIFKRYTSPAAKDIMEARLDEIIAGAKKVEEVKGVEKVEEVEGVEEPRRRVQIVEETDDSGETALVQEPAEQKATVVVEEPAVERMEFNSTGDLPSFMPMTGAAIEALPAKLKADGLEYAEERVYEMSAKIGHPLSERDNIVTLGFDSTIAKWIKTEILFKDHPGTKTTLEEITGVPWEEEARELVAKKIAAGEDDIKTNAALKDFHSAKLAESQRQAEEYKEPAQEINLRPGEIEVGIERREQRRAESVQPATEVGQSDELDSPVEGPGLPSGTAYSYDKTKLTAYPLLKINAEDITKLINDLVTNKNAFYTIVVRTEAEREKLIKLFREVIQTIPNAATDQNGDRVRVYSIESTWVPIDDGEMQVISAGEFIGPEEIANMTMAVLQHNRLSEVRLERFYERRGWATDGFALNEDTVAQIASEQGITIAEPLIEHRNRYVLSIDLEAGIVPASFKGFLLGLAIETGKAENPRYMLVVQNVYDAEIQQQLEEAINGAWMDIYEYPEGWTTKQKLQAQTRLLMGLDVKGVTLLTGTAEQPIPMAIEPPILNTQPNPDSPVTAQSDRHRVYIIITGEPLPVNKTSKPGEEDQYDIDSDKLIKGTRELLEETHVKRYY